MRWSPTLLLTIWSSLWLGGVLLTRWGPPWLGSAILTPYSSVGNTLGFETEQIAIFIGELYFMLPFTVQVKHLIPFPGMEIHQNILNKMN